MVTIEADSGTLEVARNIFVQSGHSGKIELLETAKSGTGWRRRARPSAVCTKLSPAARCSTRSGNTVVTWALGKPQAGGGGRFESARAQEGVVEVLKL